MTSILLSAKANSIACQRSQKTLIHFLSAANDAEAIAIETLINLLAPR